MTAGACNLPHSCSPASQVARDNEYEKIVDEKPKLGYEFQLSDVFQRITPTNGPQR